MIIGGIVAGSGSSPLAQGTLMSMQSTERTPGLIPARAGNIPSQHDRSSRRPAHPRSHGEHHFDGQKTGTQGGSSPLARGTLLRGAACLVHHRLIPACEGNTSAVHSVPAPDPAHPRLRGEHV